MKPIPIIAATLALALAATAWSAENPKPNIIVIMADDMGYADAGFTGAKDIKTPNLDALAASGVIFENGYVNHPFCGPSRAALLSGRYQHRFGFETNPAYDPNNPHCGIDAGETLFPKRLQDAGYETGVIGKWHLGAASPFHPNHRGFDYFYGFLGGGHDYFRIDLREPVREGYFQALERNGKPADFDGYLATALSRDAVRFVESNKSKPFFLYLAYNAPHTPLQAPEEAIAKYSHIKNKKRRVYAAMIDVMDEGIGEVITALDRNGLRENTLVFFLSDNGGPQGGNSSNASDNGEFRGGKGDFYDGGIHVPFIASWPARIPKNSRYEKPVIAIDISRTAVAVANADAQKTPAMEGVNLIPFVTGGKSGAPHDAIFWRGADGARLSILSSDRYKYLKLGTKEKTELYQLAGDVSEKNNVVTEHPELAQKLEQQLMAWNESNFANRLTPYKQYHQQRDEFFLEAIPDGATEQGYKPEKIPTLK